MFALAPAGHGKPTGKGYKWNSKCKPEAMAHICEQICNLGIWETEERG